MTIYRLSNSTKIFSGFLLLTHIAHSVFERKEGASFIQWYTYAIYSRLEFIAIVLVVVAYILLLSNNKNIILPWTVYVIVMFINGIFHIGTLLLEKGLFLENYGSYTTSGLFLVLGPFILYTILKPKIITHV